MDDNSKCLVSKGSHVEKGDCNSGSALKWGVIDGQMSQGYGKNCVARLQDNSAALGRHICSVFVNSMIHHPVNNCFNPARCTEASEYMALEVPQTYSAEELTAMLQNQVCKFSHLHYCWVTQMKAQLYTTTIDILRTN